MRLLFLFYLVSLCCGACHQTKRVRPSRFDSIAPIDTTCQREVIAARAAILKGNLTYCHFIGMMTTPVRNEKEFINELRKYDISYRTELVSDVVTDQTQGCFCDLMQDEIRARYGVNFIDSIQNVSDSLFLIDHISDTISYMECDAPARYPADPDSSHDEFSLVLQQHCDSLIKYPVGYIKADSNLNESNFVNVYFVVTNRGDAAIDGYNFLFSAKGNNQFQVYFKQQIQKIVKKRGWVPAQIRKQPVTSENTLRIYFE